MKIEQSRFFKKKGWDPAPAGALGEKVQFVIVFGDRNLLLKEKYLEVINKAYPKAYIWGCSTAGEIYDTQVSDESIVVTAVHFEHSHIKTMHTKISDMSDSFEAGESLAKSIDMKDLAHIFVLSDGLNVNGSDLVKGITKHLSSDVSVTGGLSGDGDRFTETLVFADNAQPETKTISIAALYGNRLSLGHGSLGGWDQFGPERLVTKSKGNILYELDGESALELYEKYLGEDAKGLPATGLLFPLCVRRQEDEKGVVRTILAVDKQKKSMIFAGDIQEGYFARLMKANFNRLIDGAVGAALECKKGMTNLEPDLAILISCVGRKMVLKQRIEEEVEGVREVVGEKTFLTGFYSYGEISPFNNNSRCEQSELHNQTMTITTVSEV